MYIWLFDVRPRNLDLNKLMTKGREDSLNLTAFETVLMKKKKARVSNVSNSILNCACNVPAENRFHILHSALGMFLVVIDKTCKYRGNYFCLYRPPAVPRRKYKPFLPIFHLFF